MEFNVSNIPPIQIDMGTANREILQNIVRKYNEDDSSGDLDAAANELSELGISINGVPLVKLLDEESVGETLSSMNLGFLTPQAESKEMDGVRVAPIIWIAIGVVLTSIPGDVPK